MVIRIGEEHRWAPDSASPARPAPAAAARRPTTSTRPRCPVAPSTPRAASLAPVSDEPRVQSEHGQGSHHQDQAEHEDERLPADGSRARRGDPGAEHHEQARDEQDPDGLVELEELAHLSPLLGADRDAHDRDGQEAALVHDRVGGGEDAEGQGQAERGDEASGTRYRRSRTSATPPRPAPTTSPTTANGDEAADHDRSRGAESSARRRPRRRARPGRRRSGRSRMPSAFRIGPTRPARAGSWPAAARRRSGR